MNISMKRAAGLRRPGCQPQRLNSNRALIGAHCVTTCSFVRAHSNQQIAGANPPPFIAARPTIFPPGGRLIRLVHAGSQRPSRYKWTPSSWATGRINPCWIAIHPSSASVWHHSEQLRAGYSHRSGQYQYSNRIHMEEWQRGWSDCINPIVCNIKRLLPKPIKTNAQLETDFLTSFWQSHLHMQDAKTLDRWRPMPPSPPPPTPPPLPTSFASSQRRTSAKQKRKKTFCRQIDRNSFRMRRVWNSFAPFVTFPLQYSFSPPSSSPSSFLLNHWLTDNRTPNPPSLPLSLSTPPHHPFNASRLKWLECQRCPVRVGANRPNERVQLRSDFASYRNGDEPQITQEVTPD